jgi:hypothetical protein
MAEAPSFAKLVPGFDFLQNLVKNAGSALPSIGQWVAPTLDPEELEKRIGELRTVQFWLEQNARMLEATIQALEVQRMTLSTLKTMNVQMEDLRDSLQIRLPEALTPAPAAPPATGAPRAAIGARHTETAGENGEGGDEGAGDDAAPVEAAKKRARPASRGAAATPSGGTAAPNAGRVAGTSSGPVDPLQWWGALTKQFTELAANAMKDSTAEAARSLAGQAMKQSIEAAGAALKSAGAHGAATGSEVERQQERGNQGQGESKAGAGRRTGARRAGANADAAPAASRKRAAVKR